jgi:hypothetical protein
MDTESLLARNLRSVFNQRDTALREAAIAALYTDDCVFREADGEVRGRKALGEKVEALLDGAPGFVFTTVEGPDVIHDLERLTWGLGPPGASPVVTGMDVALTSGGRIQYLYTFVAAPTKARPAR